MIARPLPVPAGAAVLDLLPALRAALEGGSPVLPYAADGPPPSVPPRVTASEDLPPELALAVGTSGSTGEPKRAMLTSAALRASADATHERLGGAGQWLLAMPAHHIAGLQVLVRSVLAGTVPVVLDLAAGFSAAGFAEAVDHLRADRRYTALVPTQLARLLHEPAGLRALQALDGVLVGGAATAPTLLDQARDREVTTLTTYGMSETAGGCVYDGIPLSCSRIRADEEGRLHLGGDTVALGYLGRPDLTAAVFSTDAEGVRWFATDDLGHRDERGHWHVDGRLDDVITTGGLKVAPRLVEEALTAHLPGVREAVVVGVPDAEWGEVLGALLVLAPGHQRPGTEQVRSALRPHLPAYALPRLVRCATELPLRGPGKPDRAAVRTILGRPA